MKPQEELVLDRNTRDSSFHDGRGLELVGDSADDEGREHDEPAERVHAAARDDSVNLTSVHRRHAP